MSFIWLRRLLAVSITLSFFLPFLPLSFFLSPFLTAFFLPFLPLSFLFLSLFLSSFFPLSLFFEPSLSLSQILFFCCAVTLFFTFSFLPHTLLLASNRAALSLESKRTNEEREEMKVVAPRKEGKKKERGERERKREKERERGERERKKERREREKEERPNGRPRLLSLVFLFSFFFLSIFLDKLLSSSNMRTSDNGTI